MWYLGERACMDKKITRKVLFDILEFLLPNIKFNYKEILNDMIYLNLKYVLVSH